MFLELDAKAILATVERLRDRIRERFPTASLARVADELVGVTKAHSVRSAAIRRPSYAPRLTCLLLLLAGIALVVLATQQVHPKVGDNWRLPDLLQSIEATLGSLVFLGAGFAFAWSIDARSKRRRCLDALHEMRAMAHIVDMHQLTKDPDHVQSALPDTASSPKRTLDRHELARYLDYCSEMLSLIGKVAALYVQGFHDPVALSAVDDIEDLTTWLARKIWQKIMILGQASPCPPPTATEQPSTPPSSTQ